MPKKNYENVNNFCSEKVTLSFLILWIYRYLRNMKQKHIYIFNLKIDNNIIYVPLLVGQAQIFFFCGNKDGVCQDSPAKNIHTII